MYRGVRTSAAVSRVKHRRGSRRARWTSANSSVILIESVTSIALLRESSTMPGEYCVLASKRVTGEWHLHGGTVESGESASDAARRESMEEHGVTVLKLEYVGTYYYPTRKVSLYVSFPGEWFGPVVLKDKKNVDVIWQEQRRLDELTPALPSLMMSKHGLDGYLQGRRERMAAESARKEEEDKERRAKAREQQIAWREAHPHATTEATISAESVQAAREQPPRAEQLAADAAWFASTASVRNQDVGRLHDVEQRVMMGVAKNSVVHYQAIQDGTCPVPSSPTKYVWVLADTERRVSQWQPQAGAWHVLQRELHDSPVGRGANAIAWSAAAKAELRTSGPPFTAWCQDLLEVFRLRLALGLPMTRSLLCAVLKPPWPLVDLGGMVVVPSTTTLESTNEGTSHVTDRAACTTTVLKRARPIALADGAHDGSTTATVEGGADAGGAHEGGTGAAPEPHASTEATMSAAAALHAELHRSDSPPDADEADKLDDERILEELGVGRDSVK